MEEKDCGMERVAKVEKEARDTSRMGLGFAIFNVEMLKIFNVEMLKC